MNDQAGSGLGVAALADLDHDRLVEALRGRLADRAPRRLTLPERYRAAAVAVLLVERAARTHVLLTVRSTDLRQHSGQIALPGGVCDDGDVSFAKALEDTPTRFGVAINRQRCGRPVTAEPELRIGL
mgnify:CR=1 FL=1